MSEDNTIPTSISDSISKLDTNSRVAFQRRLTNLETFIANEVNPVENEIIELKSKLIPLYDAAKMLRDEAREFCTHAPEMLVELEDNTYKCKFCETIFHINA